MAAVAKEISSALRDLMSKGVKRERIAGIDCERSRLDRAAEDGIVRHLCDLHEAQNRGKSLSDQVEHRSEVERRFARGLDGNENVKVFARLPSRFKIDTPAGPCSSDWVRSIFFGEIRFVLSRAVRFRRFRGLPSGPARFSMDVTRGGFRRPAHGGRRASGLEQKRPA